MAVGSSIRGRWLLSFVFMPGPGITITAHSGGDAKAWENPAHEDEVTEKEQNQTDEFGHKGSTANFRYPSSIVERKDPARVR